MMDGSRRDFLRSAGLAVLSLRPSAQQPDSLGKVYDPARAGRPLPPVTAADNDAGIQEIEKQLKCSCGCGLDIYTCRTTDFSCTYSPELHKRVLAMADQGKSAREIIDAFVGEYGQQVLMAPPKRGFNLAGYFVPSLLIVIAAVVLVVVLRRWTRAAAVHPAGAAAPPDASPDELERLRRELDRLPG